MRTGIEGTIAQGVRTGEIRRSRYIGLKKLGLQASLTATSLNMLRTCHWVAQEKLATPPSFRFAKLVASCGIWGCRLADGNSPTLS